jgi:serine/threonine protein kinase
MEYIEGQTLHQLMRSGPVPLNVFLNIARALDKLLRDTTFGYHGDLKPENIIIAKDGTIKFIDPGYFGKLKDEGGNMVDATITTPIYYPLMKPDDVFALGLIIWESTFANHPLMAKVSSDELDCEGIGEDLLQHIRGLEMTGNYNLSAILTLKNVDAGTPDMPPEVRSFLLKCLRLRSGTALSLDTGFQSPSQLAGALISLIERDIAHF